MKTARAGQLAVGDDDDPAVLARADEPADSLSKRERGEREVVVLVGVAFRILLANAWLDWRKALVFALSSAGIAQWLRRRQSRSIDPHEMLGQ